MTGATENQPRFVTMQQKLAENRERLERNRMKDKSEPASPDMTLRQYYFGQVAPAWVLAMSMRFHHEGYDDESAMMEAVRKAYQTANEMIAMQETKR